MRLTNPENVIPGLREAREAERFARYAAFAGLSLPILGLECEQLTPRHRLEFEMAQNAFSVGREASRADVFQFLWRMSPAWRKGQPITISATLAWWRIHRVIYRHPLPDIEAAILDYIGMMLQDLPEAEAGSGSGSVNPSSNYVTWVACESDFYMRTYGMMFSEYYRTPYLVLQQLYRAYRLATEDNATFINSSDRIVSAWIRTHRKNGSN
jgi:hypothetical protein